MSPGLRKFRNICAIMANIDKDELENAGLIKPGQVGGSDWTRFNADPLMFVLKLPDDHLERLWELLEDRQPFELQEK